MSDQQPDPRPRGQQPPGQEHGQPRGPEPSTPAGEQRPPRPNAGQPPHSPPQQPRPPHSEPAPGQRPEPSHQPPHAQQPLGPPYQQPPPQAAWPRTQQPHPGQPYAQHPPQTAYPRVEPEVVPSAQPQSRGCATAAVAAAALALVLLAAGAVWYVATRDAPETGDFESAPECAVAETETLGELVPAYELEVEEPVGGRQSPFGSGWQCRWATPGGPGEEVPATATLVVVAAPNPGGVTTAVDNLRTTTSGHETRELDGIGDEAVAWIQGEPYTVSCVGARVSNLYLETCYSTAAGYDAVEPGAEDRIIDGSEEFAASVVDALPESVPE